MDDLNDDIDQWFQLLDDVAFPPNLMMSKFANALTTLGHKIIFFEKKMTWELGFGYANSHT